MKMKAILLATGAGILLLSNALAQRRVSNEEASWAQKPLQVPKYTPPHKPHTKIADVKAAHKGHADWSQIVVDDDHLHGEYIYSAPGTKVSRRFHPDTRAWWVVLEGEIRFEIEGQEPFTATRGSMVQAPMQTIFSMETVGGKPSLRWEVNIAKAKTLYPKDVEPPKMPGWEWTPVRLNRRPGAWENGNKPHINLFELAKQPDYRGGRFVHDDRAVSNIIYGNASKLPPYDPKMRGHYHPECAEFWLIMTGKIMYPIEGLKDPVIATEGDIVYVPPFTFHAPRFHGDEPSCRLAMNGFTNIAHLVDAVQPH